MNGSILRKCYDLETAIISISQNTIAFVFLAIVELGKRILAYFLSDAFKSLDLLFFLLISLISGAR